MVQNVGHHHEVVTASLVHPQLTKDPNMTTDANGQKLAPSIDVKKLSYAFPDGSSGLKEVFLNLPPGSRTLLIGGLTYSTHVRCAIANSV